MYSTQPCDRRRRPESCAAVTQASNAATRRAPAPCDRRASQRRPAIECVTPSSQAGERVGVRASATPPRRPRAHACAQDRVHHLVLERRRELRGSRSRRADVRALARVARARHCVYTVAPPKFGPEAVVAAREVAHVEARVHRVRLPSRGTRSARLRATARSTSASMPCSLDSTSLKFAEAELVLLDHVDTSRLPSLPGSMP